MRRPPRSIATGPHPECPRAAPGPSDPHADRLFEGNPMVRRPAALALVGVAVLAVLAGAAPGPGPAVRWATIRGAGAAGAIPDAYIVVFADGGGAAKRVRSAAAGYALRYSGRVTGTFSDAVRGF